MKRSSPFIRCRESGFSLLEMMLAVGLLGFLSSGFVIKLKAMRDSLNNNAAIMARDALESSISAMVRNPDLVRYSLEKAGASALLSCLKGETLCKDGVNMQLPLFREGQPKPFTGADVYYDKNGSLCAERCPGFRFSTVVTARCVVDGSTCTKPSYVLVVGRITDSTSGTLLRELVQEVDEVVDKKLSELSLQCPLNDSLIYGIGLNGDALCTPLADIVLKGPAAETPGASSLQASDCRTNNQSASDQFFVSAIDASGKVSCAPKFW